MGIGVSRGERGGLRLKGAGCVEGLAFVLRPGENRVGAREGNEIVIQHAGVSRLHALLQLNEGACELRDLGSKNGTAVNGVSVQQATLRAGDIVTFGPAPFVVERVASSDAYVAIALPPGLVDLSSRRTRFTGATTSSGGQRSVPERWLGVVGRIAEMVADEASPDLSGALAVLRDGLDADSTAVVEWSRRGEVVVRQVQGCFALPDDFEPIRQFLDSVGNDHSKEPRFRRLLSAGPPPLVLAVCTLPDGLVRALVCTGDFRAREASGGLVEAALRVMLPRLPGAQGGGGRKQRRPLADLEFPPGHVVGRSEAMQGVYQELRQLLQGDIPVLITGETGVGKEHIALILHGSSERRGGPFQAVNCAAIPAELLEAELFGIEAGVATGVARRDGKMLLASGGVVFLDEIGDMSPALQAKLLRALQEKEVHPVGARRPLRFDARVVAATNSDLQGRIAEGRFRADLYYRIAGYSLRVPPLRERRSDIPVLVEHFMVKVAGEVAKSIRGITTKALRGLVEAAWPGNVRELEHQVRRLVYLCPPGQAIAASLLPPDLDRPGGRTNADDTGDDAGDLTLVSRVAELERRMILDALRRTGGNLSSAAKLLAISRYGLRLKMKRLHLTARQAPAS
ncbi:MAG: sigma 54-interacting transcriptional regulator [Acidobacteria bacterium]|nr:sigma 54-interacting transcriptional regulator [Acidobacteriota bacterium]